MAAISTPEELGLRIRDAREAKERSQAQVANALGVDRSSVTRIEQGERGVSTLELVRLSEFFDLPVAYFLEVPVPAVTSQRAPIGDDPNLTERARFRADTILDARSRSAQFLLDEGTLPRASHPIETRTVSTPADAHRVAREAREAAGLIGPVPSIQDVCEGFGLYIFVEQIGIDGASRSPDTDFGVAIVRNADDPGRRRATAAHELGHHVLGDAYTCDFGAATTDHEKNIDAFAAEFLLPVDDLRNRRTQDADTDIWDFLVEAAAHYRVSWTLACRVTAAAGLIDGPLARRFATRAPVKADLLRITGRAVNDDLTYRSYGAKWTRAVMLAHTQDSITRTRAEELLQGSDPFAGSPNQ